MKGAEVRSQLSAKQQGVVAAALQSVWDRAAVTFVDAINATECDGTCSATKETDGVHLGENLYWDSDDCFFVDTHADTNWAQGTLYGIVDAASSLGLFLTLIFPEPGA